MEKSNTEENGIFVKLQKFEGSLQDAAKPDPVGYIPVGKRKWIIIA